MVYDYMEKANLTEGLSESKTKTGGNHAFFSQIIELPINNDLLRHKQGKINDKNCCFGVFMTPLFIFTPSVMLILAPTLL